MIERAVTRCTETLAIYLGRESKRFILLPPYAGYAM